MKGLVFGPALFFRYRSRQRRPASIRDPLTASESSSHLKQRATAGADRWHAPGCKSAERCKQAEQYYHRGHEREKIWSGDWPVSQNQEF